MAVTLAIIIMDLIAVFYYVSLQINKRTKSATILNKRKYNTKSSRYFISYKEHPVKKNSYFSECKNADQLRAKYISLCKSMHPDAGGNEKDFCKLVEEYKKLSKNMKAV